MMEPAAVIFKVGEPVPEAWLHMEFDWDGARDTPGN